MLTTRRKRAGTAAATTAATILTAWCGDAFACPFCSTAKTGTGYLLATVVLLVVPLVALAGFALWVRRCTRIPTQPADRGGESPP